MLVSPPQNKTWHGRLRKSGEKQQKLRHYSLSININKYCIVMIMVHRHHIRAEKEEWKTALEVNMLVKIIKVVAGIKLNRTDSYLLLLIIHILNVLRKLSVSVFTVSLSYENILSQNSQSTRRSLYRRVLNSVCSWNFPQV